MAVEDDSNSSDNGNPKTVVGSFSDLKLSFGDPFYLHPNDTSGTPIILNSLSPELFVGAIYAKIASEIWNDLKETYDMVDGSAVLPACTCVAAKHFDQHNQLIKLMQFLMRLDESYLAIRSNLLTIEPLPSVKSAFFVISGEESHRNVTSGGTTKPAATAFAAKTFDNKKKVNNNYKGSGSNSNSNSNNNNRGPNPNLKCTNFNKTGHTVDRCFELIGYLVAHVKRNFNSYSGPVTSNNASADVLFNGVSSNNATTGNSHDLKANRNVGIGKQYNGLYLSDVDNACKPASNNCIASWRVSSNDDGQELSIDANQGNDDSGATSMDVKNNTHPEGTVSDETNFLNDFYLNSEFNSKTEELPVHTLRRSSRQTKSPSSLNDFVVEGKVKYGIERVVNYANLNHDNYCFASALNKSVEPTSYEEAILDSNWIDAMIFKIEALNENHTWEITDLPPNRKAIGNKLVVKGFNQKEGIDFDETFSPVVKMSTVKCVIALSITNNWPLFKLDVNNAFLYGDLDEDIYMTIPKGFVSKDKKTKKYCLELLKDYGLLGRKPVSTPMEPNLVFPYVPTKDDPLLENITGYQKLLGKLIYLTHTRPDIAYMIHCLAQYMHSPLKSHLNSALNVLGYLKGAPEAEYRSLSPASCEIIWIHKLLLDHNTKVTLPIDLHCDNKSALQLAINPVFHERLKELYTEMSDDDANGAESPPRGVDSYYRPGNFEDSSPIVYPAMANGTVSNFKIQPNLIAILPVFRGHEEPYAHLQEFFSIADTYQVNNKTKDGARLLHFPFSIKDQAKAWFTSLELGEQFHKAFSRLKELLRTFPHHDVPKLELVKVFYDGLDYQNQQFVKATSRGTFFSWPMEEEWEFFGKLSKGSKTQASVDRNNNRISFANFVSNQYETNYEISELSKKVDLLLRSLGKGVPKVSQGPPSNEEVNGVYGNRPRNDPFSKSYNPRWRNHPNFRWKDDDNRPNNTQQQNYGYQPRYKGGDSSNLQQNYQQQSSYQQRPQQYQNYSQGSSNGQQSNVDQKFNLILSELAKSNQGANLKFESLSKSVVNLEIQMRQLAKEVHKREAGKLPSYPDLNPKHKPGGPEHVNMVTSLRNGKTYKNDIKIPSVHDLSHDIKDFVTDDEIVVESNKADNVKSNYELVNDLLKDFPKPPTHNPEATESPKFGEEDVSSTTTPYIVALEKLASARLAKKGPHFEDMWETFKQRKLKETFPKKIDLTEHVSVVLSSSLPSKFKDPRAPLISIVVGNISIKKALLDLGASINILPASLVDKYDLGTLHKTGTIISLANRSTKIPRGILEDVIVKFDEFYYPVYFFVMDTGSPYKVQPTIIPGRPFLATIDDRINCRTDAMDIAFNNKKLCLNVFNSMNSPTMNECCQVDVIDEEVQKHAPRMLKDDPLDLYLTGENAEILDVAIVQEIQECLVSSLDHQRPPLSYKVEPLPANFDTTTKPSLEITRGGTIENVKPSRDAQRHLNPNMKEVVKKEVIKWLDVDIIYPISNSKWVSPTQTVPKKAGIIVVETESREKLTTRLVIGWKVCIDYHKLNNATSKDHFPLPFIDQIVEKLSSQKLYCFLDRYSRYNQIPIHLDNQAKTTFTCPYGTFAFRRMTFGLCNAPATF
ncbi:putative nucleotidyltransferase, ribonuclease H [Tanacetum coccineum]